VAALTVDDGDHDEVESTTLPRSAKGAGLQHHVAELDTPNDVPDNSELPIVRQLLANALYNLNIIDEVILLVQSVQVPVHSLYNHDTLLGDTEIPRIRSSTPSSLLFLRDVRHARVSTFRAALASHKKVPPELLVKIFLDTCPSHPNSLPPHSRTRPWAISQVCARWRKVALNEPHLWGNLSITTNRRLSSLYPIRMRDVYARSAGMRISLQNDRGTYTGPALEADTIIDIVGFVTRVVGISEVESAVATVGMEATRPPRTKTPSRSLRRVEIRSSRDYGHSCTRSVGLCLTSLGTINFPLVWSGCCGFSASMTSHDSLHELWIV